MISAGGAATETALPPIPWNFSNADGGAFVWDTPLFRAVISSSSGGHYWEVAHVAGGGAKAIRSDVAADFAAAEVAVRETIGKAYRPDSGYRHFAGALATTFQLADGSWLDFAPLERHQVVLTVRRADGGTETHTGELRVSHYTVTVDSRERDLLAVLPHSVVSARTIEGIAPQTTTSAKPRSRITQGKPEAGCTGRAGFVGGTVDHLGAPECPLHESRTSG